MTTKETGAPNLDAMDISDLNEFLQQGFGLRIQAIDLFPTKPRGYCDATRALRKYADCKVMALRARQQHNIQIAIKLEDICDRIYKSLPIFARW